MNQDCYRNNRRSFPFAALQTLAHSTRTINLEKYVLDDNEIMARNNGAASSLNLQTDGGDLLIHNNRPTGERVIIQSDGDVGIGTTSPAQDLDVAGEVRIDSHSATYDVWIQGGGGSGDDRNLALLGYDEDSGDYLRMNYNNEYAGGTRIDGRVGIGAAPVSGAALRVNGTIRANNVCDENGNNCLDVSTLFDINANEDSYGAFVNGTLSDTCNGNTSAAYVCAANTNQNCRDRISGTTTYACGKDNSSTCTSTTNRYRSVNCRRLRVQGILVQ